MPNLQVAIDGPAASGKSTVAGLVASRLGGYYINTGDMYRTVTWLALQRGIEVESDPASVVELVHATDLQYVVNSAGEPELQLDALPVPSDRIRGPLVARHVSAVAKIPAVRDWMHCRQRQTRRLGTIVMEGRDIGTVVFPATRFKFFLTASPRVRARRRLAQQSEVAAGATVDSVAAEIARRDHLDSSRAVDPLKAADDAVIIDTDNLAAQQVADIIVKRIQKEPATGGTD